MLKYVNFLPLDETVMHAVRQKDQEISNHIYYLQTVNGRFVSSKEYTAVLINVATSEILGTCSLQLCEDSNCMLTIELVGKEAIVERLVYERTNNDYLIYKSKAFILDFNWKSNLS